MIHKLSAKYTNTTAEFQSEFFLTEPSHSGHMVNRTPLDIWEASPKQPLVIRQWGEFPGLLRFAGGGESIWLWKIFLGKAVIAIEGK